LPHPLETPTARAQSKRFIDKELVISYNVENEVLYCSMNRVLFQNEVGFGGD